MYRIIVSDLDETLLNDAKKVSEDDKRAIASLNGVRFAIASGRGFTSLQDALMQVGLYNAKDSYTISLNGGIITENFENRIIYCQPLKYEEAVMLFKMGLKLEKCIHIYTPYKTYVYGLTEEERIYVNGRIDLFPLESPDISFLRNEQILKVLYVDPDMNELKKLRKQLDLEDKFAITFSANRYLEFNPLGVDKGMALKKLCEILSIDIKESIAVGDSVNDKRMLEEAGLSIGVANAVKDIRDVCDVILDSDNNHSPLSEIAERFIKR